MAGAVVSVVDSTDQVAARAITDGVGTFSLIAPPRAARLRVIRIGYQPRDVMLVGDTSGIRISMARLPTTLAAMRVTGRELCPGSEDRGPAFQLWEQARAGLLATVVARESNPAEAASMRFKRSMKVGSDLVRHLEIKTTSGTATQPLIASHSAAAFSVQGYMSEDANGREFFGPDADVLLDEAFATTHCFHLVNGDSDVRAVSIEEDGGQVLRAEWRDGTKWRAPESGIVGQPRTRAASSGRSVLGFHRPAVGVVFAFLEASRRQYERPQKTP